MDDNGTIENMNPQLLKRLVNKRKAVFLYKRQTIFNELFNWLVLIHLQFVLLVQCQPHYWRGCQELDHDLFADTRCNIREHIENSPLLQPSWTSRRPFYF